MEKIKVLYLDDEINNLHAFKASFRLDYNVLIANSAAEATEQVDKNPDVRVIVCDQRMPDMTGVEFFEQIRGKHSMPIRMLLTGYTDIESVISAINKGNIFRYIKKPWTDADIKSAIDEGNKFYMANSMLAIKNEELQKAYAELDKFAYSVTHDMRGPLLSILGAVDVARNIDEISEIREMLDLMEKSVKKLDNFIQNVHDYYNMKRGELQVVDIDFEELSEDQEDMNKIICKLNNIKFTTTVKQEGAFRGDIITLKVILNNLLSNAFKYQRKNNPDKFVDMVIEATRGVATITVTDNGIGIPDNHHGKIFNMFFRATTDEIGSGFGLYNVKDALLKLNGTITVDSVVDKGSKFVVTIPSK
ncbi:MAG: hybrid sensor histidine kinase/response regulator [Taibaiella sp.]|nr:hybrid sensor histidine kinase/response regulator [Taibaiella sp.]